MRKSLLFVAYLINIFLFTTKVHAQISTGIGGGESIFQNIPNTNTNVGIGTNNPTAMLEIREDIKAKQGFFLNSLPNGSVFTSWKDRNDQCLVLSAGALLGSGPAYINTRMLQFF